MTDVIVQVCNKEPRKLKSAARSPQHANAYAFPNDAAPKTLNAF